MHWGICIAIWSRMLGNKAYPCEVCADFASVLCAFESYLEQQIKLFISQYVYLGKMRC